MNPSIGNIWARLAAFAVGGAAFLFPALLLACPQCAGSSPFQTGLQWAVLVLLPIPPAMALFLFWWVRRGTKNSDS